ncbi:hypothetical protein D3C77_329590 [compost metagenome]
MLALRARVAAAVAGVDDDQGLLRSRRLAARRRGRRGRGGARGLQVDDVAIMINPVARRQQEAALDLGSARQVQPHARRPGRGADLIAAHQARAASL